MTPLAVFFSNHCTINELLTCHQSMFFRPWHFACLRGLLADLGKKISLAPRVQAVWGCTMKVLYNL